MPILSDRRPRPWQVPEGGRDRIFAASGYFLGRGTGAQLEVAVATARGRPTEGDVRNLWKRRKSNQPSPLLLIILWPAGGAKERATVCGPVGEDPAVYSDRDPSQVGRIAALALEEPDHHAAVRLLSEYLSTETGGLRNVGLFATHHLVERVPRRPDWAQLCREGEELLGLRREQLVKSLGYTLESRPPAAVLRVAGQSRVLAVFLDEQEAADAADARFNGMTPSSWALAFATADNIPFVVVTRGSQIRMYQTRTAGIAGTRGGGTNFVELNLALLDATDAGYLPLLFSADALVDGGRFVQLLDESHDFAADLGARLRSRVYDQAIPAIAQALITRYEGDGGATDDAALRSLYDRALLVLFRLLFVAYAEDRGLLPLSTNGLYRQKSLKQIAHQLADRANAEGLDDLGFDEHATDLWDQVRALWTAIDRGRKEWNVPVYNGGVFSTDPEVNPDGAALTDISLTDAEFGPALLGLLVDVGDGGSYGPVDFASLDVREFGTIYEGLLESNLSVAPCDLTTGRNGAWEPAKLKDRIEVTEGSIYLHNQSGIRKSTGSYFTKPFAVRHLLDCALEPALDEHIGRLTGLIESGDQIAAAETFFDFRCMDPAMGSGHFLVAAVDRIEARLSKLLADHQVTGVLVELRRLSDAAAESLEAAGLTPEGVDTSALLRRQIARRCVYGVDLNPTAVELARLALWIHTFVKGLPLTSLNHGLVVGNTLTGVGTLDEALDTLDPSRQSLVRAAVEGALEPAREALQRFAATSEATAAEVKQARQAHTDAERAVEPARKLLDLVVAVRMGAVDTRLLGYSPEEFMAVADRLDARKLADSVQALHCPVAFPEVFLRERPGFDCILGNPPWDETNVEELGFYALRFPGLKSLRQAAQQAEIKKIKRGRPDLVDEYEQAVAKAKLVAALLNSGPFPGMGTGNPDVYKAFVWRFWQLLRDGGAAGVVLPRSALSGAGSANWREAVLRGGTFSDVTMVLNRGQWVFPDVHPQYTIGLVTIRKGPGFAGSLCLRGPYASLEQFAAGVSTPGATFPTKDFLAWSEEAAFPLLPSAPSVGVFKKFRSHPRFDEATGFRARPLQGDFNATTDKSLFVMADDRPAEDYWPVYKGASFNLWEPDTGSYYGWADPTTIVPILEAKRRTSARRSDSPFGSFGTRWAEDPETLPCKAPRIAFRDVTNRTNSRTVITALVPSEIVITNQAPYLLWPKGDERDQAYLLGVLCSIPLDWYARRVVETHVNFHILNSFPIPRPDRDNPLRRRVEQLAGSLAAVDARYKGWAKAVGVPVGGLKGEEREDAVYELDALVAHVYGLDENEVRLIFQTFHEGWDNAQRLEAVLGHFRRIDIEVSR
jgi:hypothetical protein